MFAPSSRRGSHRKRVSTFRLSSDSTATTLPVYSSPSPHRHPDLSDVPSEQPPAYSDSAEEADEDTDESESETQASVTYIPSPPPSLPVSPRRARRSQGSSRSSHRRLKSISNSSSDPYLDSLLERSVHALEMSNALLQSSISTQSSLSVVLADDAAVDRHLEERAQRLNSRIRSNRDQQRSWMDDLDQITRGVEGLVNGDSSDEDDLRPLAEPPISQSLPSTSGFSERMQARADRHASVGIRRQNHQASQSTTSLQLSAHERNDFVAAAPRAITMYIDSAEAADYITLPSTLGVRPSSRAPPTPLLPHTALSGSATASERTPRSASASSERPSSRAAEMLASYVMPRGSHSRSPPASRARRRSSSSSASTVRRPRVPPPAIRVDAPSTCSSTALSSRSLTPVSGSPALRQPRPLTPPIEELSTSSASSESATLHVDRTVESLRQILEKQRSPSQSSRKPRSSSTHSAPPPPRPSLLSPPIVAPMSGTSTATASVSRLFTKGRHTTSRGQSPPRQSSLKKSSVPSTPVTPTPASPIAAMPSPSPSMLSIPDLFGLGRNKSAGSSGTSTPKRISFIEPSESYSSSKPEGSSSKLYPTKTRSASSRKGKGRGRDPKGKGKAREDESDGVGWWTSWLLGAAGTESMGVGRTRSEERYAYANPSARGGGVVGTWSMRHGYGGSLEEWGA